MVKLLRVFRPEGYQYAGALILGGALTTYLIGIGWPYAVPFYILAVFCLNFFRDPERAAPAGPVAVSPADGKVIGVVSRPGGASLVAIFMNVFDVHVNRSPIAGKVSCVTYKKGNFLVASKDEAADANEQNVLTVEGVVGGVRTKVTFKQIAGLIARRIICYKRAGDIVETGERIGLIKFGSRVDILFGPEWEITVKTGEHVSAGSSVLARIVNAQITGAETAKGDPA
jgi:phosphatidylserine decarboxylase